tara:strand:+ start:7739 stop:8032 length:294 start_codon:yes stop_codon:yes gene_type:complete
MQLFGIYTTEFENEDILLFNHVALCMTQRDIVFSTDNAVDSDVTTGDVVTESVEVEFNEQYFAFECHQGALSDQGKADFNNFLDNTLFPAIKSGAEL